MMPSRSWRSSSARSAAANSRAFFACFSCSSAEGCCQTSANFCACWMSRSSSSGLVFENSICFPAIVTTREYSCPSARVAPDAAAAAAAARADSSCSAASRTAASNCPVIGFRVTPFAARPRSRAFLLNSKISSTVFARLMSLSYAASPFIHSVTVVLPCG